MDDPVKVSIHRPGTEKKIAIELEEAKHKLELEDKQQDVLYQTCCAHTTDKRLLRFLAQFCISLIIVLFCMYRLSTHISCPEQTTYFSLISAVVGYWLTKV